MRYLGPDDLRAALPMTAAIEAMREAFGDDRETPPRALVGPSLFMPGRVGDVSGIKVVSTEPGNPVGIVAVFDARGTPLGLCHGPTLTALRTGAASGLATDLMARPDSRAMAMLGAGAMALDQVEAVRTIDRVLVWSRYHFDGNAGDLTAVSGGCGAPRHARERHRHLCPGNA